MIETVCIMVMGIMGVFCAENATAVGDCAEYNYGRDLLCIVEESELSLFLSTYDFAICEKHPTNCSNPLDPSMGAVRRLSPADYGNVAACPIDWLWRVISIPEIPLEVVCVDTGGRIHPMFREVWVFGDGPAHTEWMWVIVIDVLNNHTADPWPWWSLRTWKLD